MKFSLNGALTIGTWDGANIEMAEAMGVEHMFVFGLRANDVAALKSVGYDPRLYAEENRQLARVLDAIANGEFSPGEPQRYRGLVDNLLYRDSYLLLADFADYVKTQGEVDDLFATPAAWAAEALRNIAGMGWFSSDRAIAEYRERIWAAR
jgi:glycogen phosphorylase